jgi:hypothetical protein
MSLKYILFHCLSSKTIVSSGWYLVFN